MLKVMIFIDGSWLYHVLITLRREIKDPDLAIDYGKLPRILVKRLGEQLGTPDLDLVRTNFFASIPTNVDSRDIREIIKQQDFYDMLHEVFHYETDIHKVDFRGRRLRWEDRDPADSFVPREKCVDIALASSMLGKNVVNVSPNFLEVLALSRNIFPHINSHSVRNRQPEESNRNFAKKVGSFLFLGILRAIQ